MYLSKDFRIQVHLRVFKIKVTKGFNAEKNVKILCEVNINIGDYVAEFYQRYS